MVENIRIAESALGTDDFILSRKENKIKYSGVRFLP